MKFSLCLDPMYKEHGLDMYDRARLAAEQGYDGIEFWDPEGIDAHKMRKTCEDSHIRVVSFNCPNAWKIHMACPADEVVGNMRQAMLTARELGSANILVLSGNCDAKHSHKQEIITENLKRVALLAEEYQIRVNLEPLNSIVDHQGYFLDSSAMGFEIVKCVNSPYVKLVYDIYHMQVMEGNVIANMTENIGLIGHVHSAGCPGRHEHFTGENDYHNILRALDGAGYEGFFGSEYFPLGDSKKSAADVIRYLKSYKQAG